MDTTLRLGEPKDAKAIAQVHFASWVDAYRGLLPAPFLSEVSLEKTTSLWDGIFTPENETFTLLVEGESGLLGFIHGGKSRDPVYRLDAEIYSLYVTPEQQRRGVGSLLLRGFAEHLQNHSSYKQFYAWVLDKAPATAFFSAQGATPGRQITEETGVPHIKFHEVKYCWPSLKVGK